MMRADDSEHTATAVNAPRPAAPPNTNQGGGGSPPTDGIAGTVGNWCKHAGLCCFKFKERSQITALEMKLTNRQKKFGVDYLDLVERKAGQQALKDCLRTAMADIAEIQSEINRHTDAIERREDEVMLNQPPDEEDNPQGGGGDGGSSASANRTVNYTKKGTGPKGTASSTSARDDGTSPSPKNSSHSSKKTNPKKKTTPRTDS
jgi:hypothetical protein